LVAHAGERLMGAAAHDAPGGTTRTVFILRHGEKPPPQGVDVDGAPDDHSLVPRGWQRSGALTTLFAPFEGALRAGLLTPSELIAPAYPKHAANERTHQTLLGISGRLELQVETPFAEGEEAQLGAVLAAARTGVTLVCWEHKAIPAIADSIAPGAAIPGTWPDDRFDVVWSFSLLAGADDYAFTQIPELLLAGDSPEPIPRNGGPRP
jgi:hypothetical protein